MQEVGADKLTLRAREVGVAGEGAFHVLRPRFEHRQQVTVPALEILQYVVEDAGSGLGVHREHAIDNVVGALPVGRVEVARLGRRPEGPNHDPRRIGPQIERLAVKEGRILTRVASALGLQ